MNSVDYRIKEIIEERKREDDIILPVAVGMHIITYQVENFRQIRIQFRPIYFIVRKLRYYLHRLLGLV